MNPLISHALIGLATLVLGICVGYALSDHHKFNYQVVQSVSVSIISLIALTGLLIGITQYKNQTQCQTEYNKRFTNSIAERTSAADQDRLALQQALEAVLDPSGTEGTRRMAIQQWKNKVDEANKKRERNPIPLPPGCIEGA